MVEGEVLVSQHIGDLSDFQAASALDETLHDLLAMYELKIDDVTIAHDLHPQFVSTRLALGLPAQRHVAVQHHEAHIASVLAEQQRFDEPVIGVAFDGTGYGTDGTIWGGDFFVGSVRSGFQRAAWLRPVPLPGGDGAARYPVQAAAGFLAELAVAGELPDMSSAPFFFPSRFREALALVEKSVRCFPSSSMGRLFDAVAALLGFTREATFEGQAPIWLENLATQFARGVQKNGSTNYPFPDLDPRPLLQAIVADRVAGRDVAEISFNFHQAVAKATVERIVELSSTYKTKAIALSGGVFQNELLLDAICDRLAENLPGAEVLTNTIVPAGDGGICLGQTAIAAFTDGPR